MDYRNLGSTGVKVSPVCLGTMMFGGQTNEADSIAIMHKATDQGVNFFDTADMYNAGESEVVVGKAIADRREQVVLATKGRNRMGEGPNALGGSRLHLTRAIDESLRRLNTDRIELYYLHAPDPAVPVSESAAALKQLMEAGKILSVGVSNFNVQQLEEFAAVCPIAAYQPHYNMLQREVEQSQLPWCIEHNVSVMVYWPLMKGLLAGKLPRDHVFDAHDGRKKYPMFQGEEWQKNQDFLDALRPIAAETGRSVAQVVINWTIQRAGITCALCGAKRPEQIRDNAATLRWQLSSADVEQIDRAIEERGPIVSRGAV